MSVTTENNISILGEYPKVSIQCYTPNAQFWFLDYFVGFWVLSIFIILIFYILISYPVLSYLGYSNPLDNPGSFYLTMLVYFTCLFLKVYYCPYREHYWLFVPVATSSIILSIGVVTLGYFLISYFTGLFEVTVVPLFLQIGITSILTNLAVVVVFLLFFFFLNTSATYGIGHYSLMDSLPLKVEENEIPVETFYGFSSKTIALITIRVGVVTIVVVCVAFAVCFGVL